MSSCKNKTIIQIGKSYPKCGCGCNPCSCNNNKDYLTKPSGGEDGDLLAKNGDGVIWVSPPTGLGASTTLYIPITSNSQSTFLNAIPTGKTLFKLKVDGIEQVKELSSPPVGYPEADFRIVGQNIVWISNDFDLQTSYTLSIDIY